MAMDDIAAARDAILSRFATVWNAQGGTVPPIIYDNHKVTPPQDGSTYVKIKVQHRRGGLATLREPSAGGRFRAFGSVIVDIYGPLGDGLTANDAYVKVTQSAFEGHATSPDGVLFRDVRVREVGGAGDSYQTQVQADFEYDRIV
jgi:hypothetical protein